MMTSPIELLPPMFTLRGGSLLAENDKCLSLNAQTFNRIQGGIIMYTFAFIDLAFILYLF